MTLIEKANEMFSELDDEGSIQLQFFRNTVELTIRDGSGSVVIFENENIEKIFNFLKKHMEAKNG